MGFRMLSLWPVVTGFTSRSLPDAVSHLLLEQCQLLAYSMRFLRQLNIVSDNPRAPPRLISHYRCAFCLLFTYKTSVFLWTLDFWRRHPIITVLMLLSHYVAAAEVYPPSATGNFVTVEISKCVFGRWHSNKDVYKPSGYAQSKASDSIRRCYWEHPSVSLTLWISHASKKYRSFLRMT